MNCFTLFAILGLSITLGACSQHTQQHHAAPPAPTAQFTPDRFECPSRVPAPKAGATGDTAIRRDIAQERRGDVCQSKLKSVGRELDAAGQVVR